MAAKRIVCDTDIMIDYFDQTNTRHSETKIILEESIELNNIILSAITKMELAIGAINKTDLERISKKSNRFSIALIDHAITIKAISLIQTYSLSHGLAIPDGIIAATTIVNDSELFTYNTKDYKFITGLRLFKP